MALTYNDNNKDNKKLRKSSKAALITQEVIDSKQPNVLCCLSTSSPLSISLFNSIAADLTH